MATEPYNRQSLMKIIEDSVMTKEEQWDMIYQAAREGRLRSDDAVMRELKAKNEPKEILAGIDLKLMHRDVEAMRRVITALARDDPKPIFHGPGNWEMGEWTELLQPLIDLHVGLQQAIKCRGEWDTKWPPTSLGRYDRKRSEENGN